MVNLSLRKSSFGYEDWLLKASLILLISLDYTDIPDDIGISQYISTNESIEKREIRPMD